jgi:hypothetical protein
VTAEKEKSEKEILDRIERLEEAVFGSRHPREVKAVPGRAEGMALPDHILKLRDTGFFNSAKTSSEVHARLQTKYPCEPDRVAMALLRLQRRRELRKASKDTGGRKQVAYVL